MKTILTLWFLAIGSYPLFAQTPLTIEGTVVNNKVTGWWDGVIIPRDVPATLIYRNNSITSANKEGYMLQAGEEGINNNNNHLDGALITGNKVMWTGTDLTCITHGLFTGCNINVSVLYNYLYKVPMGIIRKSVTGMANTSGGVAYNIIISPNVGGVVKGMKNVNWYNNTFYQERSSSRPLIEIYTNDLAPTLPSTGCKVKNNIFYTKYQTLNVSVDGGSSSGFECDYNVYYCESGDPVFRFDGATKTWAQWRALGYDAHSVIVNPGFINTTDLVPTVRLDYGTNLGTAWQTGLSTTAVWVEGSSPTTANQNGKWQAGARVFNVTGTY
ncbi:MAG: hypothetical protein M0Q53_00755 [Prolixibacteraceae bacterium]|jgi:hypothetical protein|nr:hypothetical protein [Prolixibacteraceae bacterium]